MEMIRINVGIVDDHHMIRKSLVSFLQDHTLIKVVTEAGNGKELIDNISALEYVPDICIVDVSMPVMNGYSTVSYLKKNYPKMRFLALSAFENEFSIIKMIKSGANGYLLKTNNLSELEIALKSIYIDGYYYSDAASEKLFAIADKKKISEFLTEKEINFLTYCCSDLKYESIAQAMHISIRTVHDHQDVLAKKLNVHTRLGLALFAIHSGLVPITFYH